MTSTAAAEAPTHWSRHTGMAILLVTGAIGLGFLVTYGLPYFTSGSHDATLHAPHLGWLLVHIVGGGVAILAGPVQLWLGLSDRRMDVHRRLGMVYLGSVAISSVAAFGTLALHPNPRAGFASGIAGLAIAWMSTTGMAFLAIRRSQIEQHKEWMIRSYVVTFGFVAFRVIAPALRAAGIENDRGAIAAWACWAVPLLITELVLQGRKILAVAR